MNLPEIPIVVDTKAQPVSKNFSVLADSDFVLAFNFKGYTFPVGSVVEWAYGPADGSTKVSVSQTVAVASDLVNLEVDRAKVVAAGEYLWDLRVTVNAELVAWSYGEMTIRGRAGVASTVLEGDPVRMSAVDWTETGYVDISLPSNSYMLTDIFLYTDSPNTGAEYEIGVPADTNQVMESTGFAQFKAVAVTELISGGTLRLTKTVAGADGENGKIAVRGIDLS